MKMFDRPGSAAKAIARWLEHHDLLDAARADMLVLSVSLIDDAPATVQLMRSCGLTWRDLGDDLHADIVRAAFAAVDVPGFMSLPEDGRCRMMARAAEAIVGERSTRDRCEVSAIVAHGRFEPADRAAAVSRLARTARAKRVADQHAAAEHRALSEAHRAATEHQYAATQARADVERTLRCMAEQKRRLSHPGNVRAVAPVPRLAGGARAPGSDVGQRAGRVDEESARHRQRQAG